VFAVLADRTRDLNALLTQLSRSPSLSDRVALPTGIRFIFTLEGRKVSSRRLTFLLMLRFCVSKFMLYIFKIKSYNLLAFILFIQTSAAKAGSHLCAGKISTINIFMITAAVDGYFITLIVYLCPQQEAMKTALMRVHFHDR